MKTGGKGVAEDLGLETGSRVDVEELPIGGGSAFSMRRFGYVSLHLDCFLTSLPTDVSNVYLEFEIQLFQRT